MSRSRQGMRRKGAEMDLFGTHPPPPLRVSRFAATTITRPLVARPFGLLHSRYLHPLPTTLSSSSSPSSSNIHISTCSLSLLSSPSSRLVSHQLLPPAYSFCSPYSSSRRFAQTLLLLSPRPTRSSTKAANATSNGLPTLLAPGRS